MSDLTELYCEGGAGTHLEPRTYVTAVLGTYAALALDPTGNLPPIGQDGPYSDEAALCDAWLYDTPQGKWAETDGSGVCPQCLAFDVTLVRVASDRDLAELKGR
jgi:hypothetical protein